MGRAELDPLGDLAERNRRKRGFLHQLSFDTLRLKRCLQRTRVLLIHSAQEDSIRIMRRVLRVDVAQIGRHAERALERLDVRDHQFFLQDCE